MLNIRLYGTLLYGIIGRMTCVKSSLSFMKSSMVQYCFLHSFVEVLDYGYPQNCAIDLMKVLIRLGSATEDVQEDASSITSQVTGAIDW